jgi:hypothetical protein
MWLISRTLAVYIGWFALLAACSSIIRAFS